MLFTLLFFSLNKQKLTKIKAFKKLHKHLVDQDQQLAQMKRKQYSKKLQLTPILTNTFIKDFSCFSHSYVKFFIYPIYFFFKRYQKTTAGLKIASSKITPSFQQLGGAMKNSLGSLRYEIYQRKKNANHIIKLI